MARLENTFKKYLVGLMGTRWHVQSHEDQHSTGVADLSYGAGGVNGWIELKQIPAWPKLDKTLAKPSHYTAEQVNWLRGRGRKGGNCFVFVKVGSYCYYLFSWEEARNVQRGMTRTEYNERCLLRFESSIDPDILIKALTARMEMFHDVSIDGSEHGSNDSPLG